VIAWLGRTSDRAAAIILAPLTLAEGVATSIELQQIHAALLREQQVSGTTLPAARFEAFLRQSFRSPRGDPARDSWDRRYGYAVAPGGRGFAVWSLGPDGRQGTRDDIRVHWEES
jgi:hypothetical protein